MPFITLISYAAAAAGNFESPFALVRDNWDDYGFKTSYTLHSKSAGGETLIGSVKIMKIAEGANHAQEVTESFDQLSDDFISVGNSLDYYERLTELNDVLRERVLRALQDAVFLPERIDRFREEPAWSTSLFRGGSVSGQPRGQQDAFLRDANAILTRNFRALADIDTAFTFTPAGWSTSFDISYNAPGANDPKMENPGSGRDLLGMPRRIAVLIGRNGVGKSTLLARLARVAHASPQDRIRPELRRLGSLEPEGLGFMRLIAVSYSAFDSFSLPGLTVGDLNQIAEDVSKGEGRYIFCGLRDIVAEVREDIERFKAANVEATDSAVIGVGDRRSTTHLKPLDRLAEEFAALLVRINEDEDRLKTFKAALKPVLADPSFRDIGEGGIEELIGEDPVTAFLSWSTGHKIILHVIASIAAHATPRSLLLFDEPETHLHPPLIAALMAGVRIALERHCPPSATMRQIGKIA